MCDDGGWCCDHNAALVEARAHARRHGGLSSVEIIGGQGRGRRIDYARDIRIRDLRAEKLTHQRIADLVGISASGVLKALRRLARAS